MSLLSLSGVLSFSVDEGVRLRWDRYHLHDLRAYLLPDDRVGCAASVRVSGPSHRPSLPLPRHSHRQGRTSLGFIHNDGNEGYTRRQ